jgi:hypothetical protein
VSCAAGVVVIIPTAAFKGTLVADEGAVPQAPVGEKIPNIAFPEGTLRGLAGKKASVVVFLSFECPVSTSYCAILADLARTYGPRGVGFIGVTPNDGEDAADGARQAREFKLPFPVFTDKGLIAAHTFQAKVTPEVFLIDDEHILRYRGRIDDQYAAQLKRNNRVNSDDLRRALDEILAGKPVTTPATRAVGCSIFSNAKTGSSHEGKSRSSHPVARAASVTFYRDVLPILQNRCQGCHRPGEVGPFSLMTYRQAVKWAGDIKEYTQSKKMPPWKPVVGAKFQNERKLTEREILTLASWVDNGTPAGDPKDAPVPREFSSGWQLGPPDLVLTVPDEFQLGPNGPDLYRYFVLPTNLSEDRNIAAVEVRPGNRRVVHHAILFVDRKGRGLRLAQRAAANSRRPTDERGDCGPGYSLAMGLAFLPGFLPDGVLGGWSPGNVVRRFPDEVGFFLPRGADIILQLHYHRSGRTEKDRAQVGLYFSRKGDGRRIQGVTVPAQFLFIPAGAERFRVQGSVTVHQDCHLYVLMPHMHQLGRNIQISMTPPGGSAQTLVAITDWDYNWQETYFPREPIAIKAGTRLTVSGVFDNSGGNPNNPSRPPRLVLHGVQTTDEMCAGFLGVAADRGGPIRFDIHIKVPGLESLRLDLPGWGL